jgi:mono/diheme cytochrome c family protein
MKIAKVFAWIVAGVLVVAAIAVAGLYVASERRLHRRYEVAGETIAVPGDSEAAARGAHVATIRGCTGCHGADLSGTVFIDDPMFGHFYTSNLTRGAGGVGATLTPADWERAVRHGIAPDGRGLLIMPSEDLSVIGDEDLGDLIAYLVALPPVDNVLPASRPGPVGRALLVFGLAPVLPAELIDQAAPHRAAPAPALTPEYGAYLAAGCRGCHRADYAGGPVPGEPGVVAANLTMDETTGLGRWNETEFAQTLRTGARPDGTHLLPAMPLILTSSMTDVELGAIWRYLQTLPARPARTE